MTTTEAARLLGVSSTRVRQMVSEGKLRRVPSPGHATLVVRAQVERLVAQQVLGRTQAGRRDTFTSPTLGEVPQPGTVRQLVYDRLVDFPLVMTVDTQEIHVRIWTGEDGWSVVLVGTPEGGIFGHLTSRGEGTVERIMRLWPALDLRRTAFVELTPGLGGADAYDLHDFAATIDLSRGGSPIGYGRSSFVDFEQLEEAVGERPVLWHRQSYRRDMIEMYQRLGRPVRDVFDRYDVQRRAKQIEAVQACSHPVKDLVLDVLAVAASGVSTRKEGPWLPEAADIDEHRYPWTPQGSYLEAATVPEVVRELGRERGGRLDAEFSDERARCLERMDARVDSGERPASEGFETDRIEQMRRELIAFAEETDQYHDGAPLLHSAIEHALSNLPWVTVPDWAAHAELAERLPYPRVERWSWVADPRDVVTRTYLDSAALTTGGSDLAEHERTQLLESLWSDGRQAYELGRDCEGSALMVVSTPNLPPSIVILGPLRSAVTLCASDELVSGRIDVGHIPLYVERAGQIIGVVPPPSATSQMNFGYGGGGPGAAEAAILKHLRMSGFELNDAVRAACRRFTEDPRWHDGTNARVRVGDLLNDTYTREP